MTSDCAVSAPRPPHHYFAFGSNMNPQRVRDRGLEFARVCGARLAGFDLVFDKRAADHPGCGHANIAWAPERVVEGVLYELVDEQQILRMDPFERAPVNYSREVVTVLVEAAGPGTRIAAWTYIANPAVRAPGARPEAAYMAHLLEGRPWLSPAWVARLEAWPLADAPADVR